MLAPSRLAIRHPVITLVIALACVAAAAPGLTRLTLRTDGHALVPADAPEVLHDRVLRDEFGLTDAIVVVLRRDAPEGIYHAETIQRLADLTAALQRVAGVDPEDVTSLATEKSHRVRTGTLSFLNMLDPMPQTPEALDELRDDVRRVELYRGTFVSRDEKAAAIYVGVRPAADRLSVYHDILSVLREVGAGDAALHVTGAPVAESLLGTHILEDLGVPVGLIDARYALGGGRGGDDSGDRVSGAPRSFEELRLWIAQHVGLLPIAIAVMTLVFFLAFRSPVAVGLIWLKTVGCLIITFGLMGWIGSPIYLTTAVIPVILIAIGVSDEVHIFSRYGRRLALAGAQDLPPRDADPGAADIRAAACADARAVARAALAGAFEEVHRPITMTSITTSIAFLSFVISPLTPVSAFGAFTALGAMVCLAWALTATPAAVVLANPRWFLQGADCASRRAAVTGNRSLQARDPAAGQSWLTAVGLAVARRPRTVLLGSVLLLGAAALGIGRIHIQDSWIDGFSPASRFYRDTQLFNRDFLGMHILYVCVDAGNRQFRGTLDEASVDHFAVAFPLDLTDDPASLAGHALELKRAGPPRPGDNPASAAWSVRLKAAAQQGDRIVVSHDRRFGSPRFALGIQAGDNVDYVISPRRFALPETLQRVEALERFLDERAGEKVGGAIGPAAYVKTTSFLAGGRRESTYAIADKPEQLEYVWRWFANIRGQRSLRSTVDADFSRGIISLYMNNANFRDTTRLLDAIADYQREHLAPHDLSLSFAGDVAVSQTLIAAIVSTEVRSVSLSLLGVGLVCLVLTRSVKWGLLSVLPCVLAVPVNFALMGWFGIPLGVATSMFTAMTIGIGVDFAIHFVERFRRELQTGATRDAAVARTLAIAGRPIVIDALTVGLGFTVLTLSQVPANARLAIMVLTSLGTCLASTLIILPAVLSLRTPAVR